MSRVVIDLTPAVNDRVVAVAAKSGVTVNELIAAMLEMILPDVERMAERSQSPVQS